MNAQQLKNAILQEAIEGRLVPQDPNDEPASVLLARIRKEKERLVKEGKLKKKDLEVKPISEDEIPFEIPESWEWVKFGAVISLLSGRDLAPQDYNDLNNGIPYITGASNFEDGELLINRWTDKPITISRKGDLLITCKGTIGTMAYNDVGEIHIARQVMAINSYFLNLDYIKYFLMRQVYELEKKAKSIIPGISREDVLNSSFPLPPLAEQKRIVAKIEELLPKVEEYGKAQEALNKLNEELPERLKKSVLQEAITGRLVPQDSNDEPASVLLAKIRKEKEQLVKEGKLKKKDLIETPITEDEIPFEIPESWEWVRIKSIFSMQAGKNVTSADINSEQNDIFKYPCYGGNGLRGYVKGYNTEGVFPLVGRQGALCGNVNVASGQFWATEHAVVTDGFGMTPYKWQYYFLVALNLNQYATATAQPGLAVSNIVEVPIPLPPLAEQHRIVEKLEQLLGEIDKLKK